MSLAESPWTLPPAAATRPHRLRSGQVVQLWSPRAGEPHLRAWYEPAARSGRAVDDLRFLGRVERGLEPALWLYRHDGSGDELLVDVAGVAHQAADDSRRRAGFRFEAVGAPAAAATEGGIVLPFRRRAPVERSEGAE